jgi:DNA (cytosine-5)-methyltransferase 1
LPEVLEKALIQQATPSKSGGGVEIDSYGKRAGKGALVQTELSGTLGVSQDQTLFDSKHTFSMQAIGEYKDSNQASSLKQRDYKDSTDLVIDKYPTVFLEGNGYRPSHRGDGYKESDIQYTLNSTEQHGVAYGIDAYNQSSTGEQAKSLTSIASDSDHVPCVCYGLDRASFNQGKNAKYDFSVQEEISQPLVARGPGGVFTKQ